MSNTLSTIRRLVLLFLALIALPAIAQYTPNVNAQFNAGYSFQETGKTSWLAASTTTSNIALPVLSNQVQVFNTTAGIAYIIFCSSSTCIASAGSAGTTASDYPVAPGSVIVKTVPSGTTYVAVILSTGSGAVLVTPGVGL